MWTWARLGVATALIWCCRQQAAVFAIYPLWVVGGRLRKDFNPKYLRQALLFAGWGGVIVFLQFFCWKKVYGDWFVYSYTGKKFHWTAPQWDKVLFSPQHGLFYWHPAMLLGLGGFLWWWVWEKKAERLWIVPLVLTYYLNAAWWCWWFGASFRWTGS